MRPRIACLLVLLGLCFACREPTAPPPELPADLAARARTIVGWWAAGEVERVYACFDENMRKAMPVDIVERAWKSITSRMGAFDKVLGERRSRQAGYDVVFVTCGFEKQRFDVKVVFGPGGWVSGLFFVPTPEKTVPGEKGDPVVERALMYAGWITGDKFEKLYERFDATMKKAASAQKNREVFRVLLMQVGPFERITGSRKTEREGHDIVFVTCRFGRGDLDIKLVTNSAGEIAGLFYVPAAPREGPDEAGLTAKAAALVDDLVAARWEEATRDFDAAMQKALPPSMLAAAWEEAVAGLGEFGARIGTKLQRQAGYDVVFVGCRFAKLELDVKVVFDTERKVAGLFFLPRHKYARAPYVRPDAFACREVTLGEDPWKLPGTICAPTKTGAPSPGLVLVHGSGPNDRDESVGACKPFCDLAEGLASRGLAVLRYDKRTKVHGGKMGHGITVEQETIADALIAADLLRETEGVDPKRVFVLGHSLGGMLIPRIGERDTQGRIAGLIVLAGTTRPLEDVVLDQHRYLLGLDGELDEEDKAKLSQLEAQVAVVKSPELSADTPLDKLPLGIPGAYLLDLRGYDPPALAARLPHPMLVLQGERDYQVTMADFAGWKKGLAKKGNARLKTYPALNHLLVAGQGKSTPAEYSQPGHVDEQVIADIADWIETLTP
ncbi:MAG: alpha/beta fold hydrolase [Deltaproteobacteria bacterium]|nr:alpha/beta fold hydrolase [Deltaproteobacteria bacterium]